MPAEASFSVTAKGPNNELVTVRGDSWTELLGNATSAGVDVAPLYAHAFGGTPKLSAVPDEAQAETNILQAFPQAQAVAPVVPLVPQPAVLSIPAGPIPAGPACAHGARVYKSSQTKRGIWNRWECAIRWRPNNDAGNAARCHAVNA